MYPWTIQNSPHVCVPCRKVYRQYMDRCPQCKGFMAHPGYRWRAPKRINNKAWKLIEKGFWLWDTKIVVGDYSYWRKNRYNRTPGLRIGKINLKKTKVHVSQELPRCENYWSVV